jgi:hypothetical protein
MGMESGQYGMAPALIGSLAPGDLEKAVALLPASVYKLRESSGPPMSLFPRIKFPRLAKLRKVAWPIAMARSSYAAALRSRL